MNASASLPAIEVRGVHKTFRVKGGMLGKDRHVVACDDVSFAVPPGGVLGVVGESGCGKSTLARLILGLLQPTAGEIAVEGQKVADMDRRARARLIQPVFQDPFASLNPLARVRDIVAMPLRAQGNIDRADVTRRVEEMLARAGLTLQDFDYYEIHEAFAAQVLCTLKAWEDKKFCKEKLGLDKPLGKIDRKKLNIHGSSLAAGHPFAATGGRIVATLAKMLAQKGSGRGLISICAAGGQGVVAIIER